MAATPKRLTEETVLEYLESIILTIYEYPDDNLHVIAMMCEEIVPWIKEGGSNERSRD